MMSAIGAPSTTDWSGVHPDPQSKMIDKLLERDIVAMS